jgi:hypothetical protein
MGFAVPRQGIARFGLAVETLSGNRTRWTVTDAQVAVLDSRASGRLTAITAPGQEPVFTDTRLVLEPLRLVDLETLGFVDKMQFAGEVRGTITSVDEVTGGRGGALRIDHVMRLFRLYWIPDESDATKGAYVRECSEDLVRILALESVRNQVAVIGEDLGTVEDSIRHTLERFGILSYRLFYFEKNRQGGFRRYDEYPAQALVASTTHDLPTLAGFWLGTDIAARRNAGMLDDEAFRAQNENRMAEKQKMLDALFRQGLLPAHMPRSATSYRELTGELHHAIAGFLALTPAQLLAINQEDLTKEAEQQNLPGTTWQYPNWCRKMRFTIEELYSDRDARAYTAMFRDWILNSGRRNQATLTSPPS